MQENNKYIHDTSIHNTRAAREVVPFLLKKLPINSVIDVGCGLGTWLYVFQEYGIEKVLGLDGDHLDESLLNIDSSHVLKVDLEEPFEIDDNFDLAICLEVAEHLSNRSAYNLVESLTKLSNVILFSAAIPGQGGQNHINEQWVEYWEIKFRSKGYRFVDCLRSVFWENENIEWWYRQNMFLVIKEDVKHSFKKEMLAINQYVHPALFEKRTNQLQKLIEDHKELRKKFNTLCINHDKSIAYGEKLLKDKNIIYQEELKKVFLELSANKQSLLNSEQKFTELNTEFGAMRLTLEQYNVNIDKLTNEKSYLSSKILTYQNESILFSKEVNRLQEQLNNKNQELSESEINLKKIRLSFNSKLTELERVNYEQDKKTNLKINELKLLIQNKDAIIEEKLTELSSNESVIKDLRDKLEDSKLINVDLRDKLEDSKLINVDLRDKLEDSKLINVDLRDKLEDSKLINVDLRDKLNKYRTDFKILKLDHETSVAKSIELEEVKISNLALNKKNENLKNIIFDIKKSYSWKWGYSLTQFLYFFLGWIPYVKNKAKGIKNVSFFKIKLEPWSFSWVIQRIIVVLFIERRLPQFDFIKDNQSIKRNNNIITNIKSADIQNKKIIQNKTSFPSLSEVIPFKDDMVDGRKNKYNNDIEISLVSKDSKKLSKIIKRFYNKVDKINIFLIDYKSIPKFLSREKINIVRSQDYGNIGECGAFFWSDKILGYHFICDESVDYPKTYIRDMIKKLDLNSRNVVIGFEGYKIDYPYYSSKQSIKYISSSKRVKKDIHLPILGTKSIVYHSQAINISKHKFYQSELVDFWFSLIAQEQKVPLLCTSYTNGDLIEKSKKQLLSNINKDIDFLFKSHPPFVINYPKDKETILLSVTTYNREHYIKDFFESWLKTRNDDYYWRLVIADDGSTDNTLNYIHSIKAIDFDLYIIENKRKGAVGQTNTIFDLSQYFDFDFGFKADDDLLFMKTKWESLYINAIKKSGYQHLCFSHIDQINKALKNTSINKSDNEFFEYKIDKSETCIAQTNVMHAMGCFFSFTKEVIEKVGFCDEENFKVRGEWHIDYSARCCRMAFNDSDHFYDAIDSQNYITLQNFLDEDNYVNSIAWDEYKSLRTTAELSRRKALIVDTKRKYIPMKKRKEYTLSSFFDKIYVLNLDRRSDRWHALKKVSDKLEIPIERFSAIDGSSKEISNKWNKYNSSPIPTYKNIHSIQYSREYYLKYDNHRARVNFIEEKTRRKALTKGAYGYSLTYIQIIEDAIKNNYENILILDDDAVFHKEINKLFEKTFKTLPQDWYIVMLGAMQYDWDHWINPYNQFFYHCNGSSIASHAVCLKSKSFLPILYYAKMLDMPIDEGALYHIQHIYKDKCFVSYPNLVIQDVSESDISSSDRQEEEGIKEDNVFRWELDDYVDKDEKISESSNSEVDIYYVIDSFPNVPETFIMREIVNFLREGKKMRIISLRDTRWQKIIHEEVEKYDLRNLTTYLEDYKNKLSDEKKLELGYLILDKLKFLSKENKEKILFHFENEEKYLLPYLYDFVRIIEDVKNYTPKVIYCHFGNIGNMIIPIKFLFNIPILTYFHGYDFSRLPKEGIDYSLLFKKCDYFLTNSHYSKDRILEIGCPHDKIKVVGYTIDYEKIPFKVRKLHSKEIKILTVARLTEKKGLIYSIQAIAKLIKKYPSIKYTVIGEGELRNELETLISRLNAAQNIFLIGKKNNSDVIKMMLDSDIFVLSSVTAKSGDTEGLGVVLIEAQLTGMPVVATQHNGFYDSVDDNNSGFLVPEKDVDSLYSKLLYLVENPELWETLGTNGRKHIISKYSRKTVLGKIENVMKFISQ